eukprot:CAMPEP_0194496922 /NCGR_PEP_ID=MMETSP0253-20130528/14032_1 /TAXON_ID=2966 /ORGANISM="Noctiluca scintillans" /LENGTH=297 /DNA_ID=CAMNT_0039338375 /DNA_START=44 /DNA_END=937 /DNA_ORIENTATION=-
MLRFGAFVGSLILLPCRAEERRLDDIYPDTLDGSCSYGTSCTGTPATIPSNRGMCVIASTGGQCWDVCNTEHETTAYTVSSETTLNDAASNLVMDVRAGMNPGVSCTGTVRLCRSGIDTCGGTDFDEDQGMCVMVVNSPHERSCWDMCDTSIDPSDYCNPGGSEDCIDKINGMRANTVSPGCPRNWSYIWFFLLPMLLICCCIAVFSILYLMFQAKAKRTGGKPDYLQVQGPPNFVATPQYQTHVMPMQYQQPRPQMATAQPGFQSMNATMMPRPAGGSMVPGMVPQTMFTQSQQRV